jgi:hypothetical protein
MGVPQEPFNTRFPTNQKELFLIYLDFLKRFNRVHGNLPGVVKMSAGTHQRFLSDLEKH